MGMFEPSYLYIDRLMVQCNTTKRVENIVSGRKRKDMIQYAEAGRVQCGAEDGRAFSSTSRKDNLTYHKSALLHMKKIRIRHTDDICEALATVL